MGGPRVAPGTATQLRRVDFAIARVLGWATGGAPPKVFTTLARHRGVFRRWLLFASALMPGGLLPRADTELVILRVAHRCESAYELGQHEHIARGAGLSAAEVARVREGPGAAGWSPRQVLLLRAADELHDTRTMSDALWAELRPDFSDAELIELCLLVGHYEMLAMTLNALAVEPDPPPTGPPPRLLRLVRQWRRHR